MKLPTTQQLDIAIAWLQCNEGGSKEKASCEAVASYLQDLINDVFIKSEAKKAGVSVVELRRKLEGKTRKPIRRKKQDTAYAELSDFIIYGDSKKGK
jgi:hypothetical protein